MTTKSNWALGTIGGFPPMGTIRKTTLEKISPQFLATNGLFVYFNTVMEGQNQRSMAISTVKVQYCGELFFKA